MAQRDPLVEYQREGSIMFTNMMDAFLEEVVGFLFNLDVQLQQPSLTVTGGVDDVKAALAAVPDATVDTDAEPADEPVRRETAGVGAGPAKVTGGSRPLLKAKGLESRPSRALSYSAPSESGGITTTSSGGGKGDNAYAGTPRNAPCPCGSGRKYKLCHGRPQN
jgi:preprotein translocase subunit SecA